MSTVRIDKYLWAIRLYKTRSLASAACDQGKVKLGGASVKASKHIQEGEVYEVRTDLKRWVIKITSLMDKRVQYTEAIKNYEDLTPPDEEERLHFQPAAFFTGKRNSKIGRPTKKDSRDLKDFTDSDI